MDSVKELRALIITIECISRITKYHKLIYDGNKSFNTYLTFLISSDNRSTFNYSLRPKRISLFPGGPGTLFMSKPFFISARLTSPLAV